MEWISARTPPNDEGEYLVYVRWNNHDFFHIASYSHDLSELSKECFGEERRGGFYCVDDEMWYFEYDDVTHWMPLPDPPEEIQE